MRMNRIFEAGRMSWVLCEEHLLNMNMDSPAASLMLSGKKKDEVLAMELLQTAWLSSHLLSGANRPVHQARRFITLHNLDKNFHPVFLLCFASTVFLKHITYFWGHPSKSAPYMSSDHKQRIVHSHFWFNVGKSKFVMLIINSQ